MLPRDKLSYYARLRTLKPLAEGPHAIAASEVVNALLVIVLKERFPGLSRPRCSSKLLTNQAILGYADWLISLPLFDLAFWLSSTYANLVGGNVRKNNAMFFTPPELAERLIDSCLAHDGKVLMGRFIDPACGGAAFLAPMAFRIAKDLETKGKSALQILKHLERNLVGVDIEPFLTKLSKYFVEMALHKYVLNSGYHPEFKIYTANSLKMDRKKLGKFDVVICNPPYRKMKSLEVAKYKNSYGDVMEGQPNIYGLFFKLSLSLCKEKGIAGLVTPTSFLSGRDFSHLRTYLLSNSRPHQIDLVSNKNGVFVGVEQETAVTILSKAVRGDALEKDTKIYALNGKSRFDFLGDCSLPSSGLAWPVPRNKGDLKLLASTSGQTSRLVDYGYKIRIGALVWNRDKRRVYFTSKEAKCSKAAFPLIWSRDIGTSGRFSFNTRKDREHAVFVDMVKQNSASVIKLPCVALQRVTSNEQPRRLVAAPISKAFLRKYGGVVGENHVVFLEQVSQSSEISPSLLARVLRTKLIDRVFRCISGANNVSLFELSQLPLPRPAELLKAISAGLPTASAVASAFGTRS